MNESTGHLRELFTRYPGNPILRTADWPYPANAVFNPAAVRLENGDTLLLVRVEDRRGVSHLTVARSRDGVTGWEVEPAPSMYPDAGHHPEELWGIEDPATGMPVACPHACEHHPEEMWGIEDPRITWIDEIGEFAIAYTAYSRNGPLVALATTRDFRSFTHRGPIAGPEDKDAALFPRRFDGRWALIHRPVPAVAGAKANMWLSWSPDLKHWGDHMVLLEAREGSYWDALKIGLSPPPIETAAGWLIIYHGVRHTAAGAIYRLGLALLDLDHPATVLHRGEEWVFGPSAPYEQMGDVPNVVFPCGTVLDEATGELRMYYGAADSSVAVATANVSELVEWLAANNSAHDTLRRAGERGPLRSAAP